MFINSFIERHLGCFLVLAIMNKPASHDFITPTSDMSINSSKSHFLIFYKYVKGKDFTTFKIYITPLTPSGQQINYAKKNLNKIWKLLINNLKNKYGLPIEKMMLSIINDKIQK
jgi:hypothetical protein